jgi:hypothetical protein
VKSYSIRFTAAELAAIKKSGKSVYRYVRDLVEDFQSEREAIDKAHEEFEEARSRPSYRLVAWLINALLKMQNLKVRVYVRPAQDRMV